MRRYFSAIALMVVLPSNVLAQVDQNWSQREMERMQAEQERFDAQFERQRAEQERRAAQAERDRAQREQTLPPATPQAPLEPRAGKVKSIVCSGSDGTVVIDTSAESLRINIPSTLWPKKDGDGWYSIIDLVDEMTVLTGIIDLGGAKAPFTLDKFTHRLTVKKSEVSYFVTFRRALNLVANCVAR
jgi:hypothetical protein